MQAENSLSDLNYKSLTQWVVMHILQIFVNICKYMYVPSKATCKVQIHLLWPGRAWGVEAGLKNLQCVPCFSSIFDNLRENNGQAFSVTFALRLNKPIITPCYKPAQVAKSRPRARLLVLQKSGSQKFMQKDKILPVQDCHWLNPK